MLESQIWDDGLLRVGDGEHEHRHGEEHPCNACPHRALEGGHGGIEGPVWSGLGGEEGKAVPIHRSGINSSLHFRQKNELNQKILHQKGKKYYHGPVVSHDVSACDHVCSPEGDFPKVPSEGAVVDRTPEHVFRVGDIQLAVEVLACRFEPGYLPKT